MQTSPAPKFRLVPLLLSLAIPLVIGVVASLFTRPEIPVWYAGLNKPSFTPPNWLFPVAWTTLYLMIGAAAYLVWQRRSDSSTYKIAAFIYAVQLLLNFSWSIVFFGMHGIFAGLVVIVLLWVFILLNIIWFGRIYKPAAWLLVPYLLWVSYATALNTAIYILNK